MKILLVKARSIFCIIPKKTTYFYCQRLFLVLSYNYINKLKLWGKNERREIRICK